MKRIKNPSFTVEEFPKQDNYEPKCIYDVLGAIKSECLKGKQEDAEEFLSSVLNGLHDEMNMLFKYVDSENQNGLVEDARVNGHLENEDVDTNENDDALWKEVGPRHKAMPTRSVSTSEVLKYESGFYFE